MDTALYELNFDKFTQFKLTNVLLKTYYAFCQIILLVLNLLLFEQKSVQQLFEIMFELVVNTVGIRDFQK